MAALQIDDLAAAIRHAKRTLRAPLPNYRAMFEEVACAVSENARRIAAQRNASEAVIPEVAFADIAAQRVSAETVALIKARGACVIRRVFAPEVAARWDDEIADYVTRNDLDSHLAHRAEDRYFGQLQSSEPQIYGVYWSRPQVLRARIGGTHRGAGVSQPALAARERRARAFRPRNRARLCRPPAPPCAGFGFARAFGALRRRFGRALDRRQFPPRYRHVFSGDWRRYDPFDAAFRPDVNEIPSPTACSMFRTFQGWTALTPHGPGDGTLQLVPSAHAMAHILLRALQDAVPEVEHRGAGYSNAMYIASAPGCAKNDADLRRQLASFLEGRRPPDFPADRFDVGFAGRAGVPDLTPPGRTQPGLPRED